MASHHVGQVPGQGMQFGTGFGIEPVGGHVVAQLQPAPVTPALVGTVIAPGRPVTGASGRLAPGEPARPAVIRAPRTSVTGAPRTRVPARRRPLVRTPTRPAFTRPGRPAFTGLPRTPAIARAISTRTGLTWAPAIARPIPAFVRLARTATSRPGPALTVVTGTATTACPGAALSRLPRTVVVIA